MKEVISFIKKNGIGKYKENIGLKNYTTYKVGGNAKVMVYPKNVDKLILLLKELNEKNVKYKVLGNGSNLIFSDKEYDGVIIKLDELDKVSVNDTIIKVEAGYSLVKLSYLALKHGLSGLEFASGIPGTIGGAIFMNAGAYGSEIKDVLLETSGVDLSTYKSFTYSNEECKFSYRKSIFQKNENLLILSAKIKYSQGSREDIQNLMNEYKKKRVATQPLDMPSAGSTFKRGDGFITAKLIDEAGLKGYSIGGAMVSTKHAGFVVNTGNATAKDITDLIKYIQDEVYKKFNVKIEAEVKYIK